ncbi:uncharacterized protein DUF3857 [Ulvibacter sp. MAR_2010_11]|uniref:DUF3857 domain-containing protein n=1 Tax=Ulvibacter sp. MAR_2010_11 TaxID=1250229 RepID=UPI000C2C4E3F|nr:DUF3857 domain-containing protein [Ulvibacter sp. MAR_2010_11]PKA83938.1 uncharacterized protein DUF3857 [Ulvibacter sp. MAR_2010_11]
MFKFYIALASFLLFSSISVAQAAKEKELQNKFWDTGDPLKNVVEVPEKWNGESGVILYLEEFYEYTNNGKKMYNPSYFHQRVKLLDKAAVESFSEFTFEKNKQVGAGFINYFQEETTIGIKIIKPDGEEIILDIDAETVTQDEENKVAIPNLEVGDIIDLFIYEDDYLRSFSGTHIYEPEEKILSTKYPILYRKLDVIVENDYFLNMESYNGAPQIKEIPTDKKSTRRYSLEASDIERSDFPRWFYPLTELPAIKFQVTFALKAKNEAAAAVFLSENDAERKSGVTKEEIIEYYGDRFDTDSKSAVKDVLRYLEEKGIMDRREQMVQGLYYIRHMSFNRFIELYMARDNQIRYSAMPCDTDYVILNENRFVNYMAGLAKQLDIDYDVIVATSDYNGPIDQLLLRSNVSYGLRFNFPDPLYFFNLSPHVQADFFPENLEGTKVYKMSVEKNRKLEAVTFDVMPTTSAEVNKSAEKIVIEFMDDFKKVAMNRNLQFTGHFKTRELSRRLFFGDFLSEEFTHYGTKNFYNCRNRQGKSDEEAQQKMEALLATYKKQKEESIQEVVSSNFDIKIEDYIYEIEDAARYSEDPLSINDSFSLSDEFVKKAGPNYLVEVGKFIGGQVQIEEDEKERELGVYLDHAKTYEYVVDIKIPEGYEVVGLEKLQKNVSNPTGAFISTATIANGILSYTTKKMYAKRTYSAAEWSQMISWLQAAYDFSQEKVMFKKM